MLYLQIYILAQSFRIYCILIQFNQKQYNIIVQIRKFTIMQETANAITMSAIISLSNPLELIKSRYQTMNQMVDKGVLSRHYRGLTDCFRNVATQQGVKALWKGNSISIARFFPNETINFKVKNLVKSILPNNIAFNMAAGVCGGLTAAAILYPIDTVRIFIATSKQIAAKSVKQLNTCIKIQGFKYLYRGFSSCLLGISLFRGSLFGLYDTFKVYSTNNYQKTIIAYFSGLFSGLLVYPLETLRKRNILSKQRIKQTKLFKKIVSQQGFRALFRGCSMAPIQSLAGSAVLLYFDTSDNQN